MTLDIRMGDQDAGRWIMTQVEGVFTDGRDHVFSSHAGDRVLGGIVFCQYMGAALAAHMAGRENWFSRELAWLAFTYAFVHLKCHKIYGPVRSDNYKVLSMDLRGGWHFDNVLYDVYEPGVHMILLTMTRETCPWLKYKPKLFRYNAEAA